VLGFGVCAAGLRGRTGVSTCLKMLLPALLRRTGAGSLLVSDCAIGFAAFPGYSVVFMLLERVYLTNAQE
jgi:hypothetical protein